MNHTEAIETMLRHLDDWRHLPKYQLERRADLFFGLFIRQIVAAHFGDNIHNIVIPEFPFKRNDKTNHTVNFDYVLFSSNCTTVYILELKTDSNSVDDDQLCYLNEAVNFYDILNGISAVISKTQHKEKYHHLESKIMTVMNDYSDHKTCKIKDLRADAAYPEVRILYLSPELDDDKFEKVLTVVKNKENIISFSRAAELLEMTGGAVECHFASYLRRWNDIKAGNVNG